MIRETNIFAFEFACDVEGCPQICSNIVCASTREEALEKAIVNMCYPAFNQHNTWHVEAKGTDEQRVYCPGHWQEISAARRQASKAVGV